MNLQGKELPGMSKGQRHQGYDKDQRHQGYEQLALQEGIRKGTWEGSSQGAN